MVPVRIFVIGVALLPLGCKPSTKSDVASGAPSSSSPSSSSRLDAALAPAEATTPSATADAPPKDALERMLRAAFPSGPAPSESELREQFADIRSHARPEERPLVDRAEKLAGELSKIMAGFAVTGSGSAAEAEARARPQLEHFLGEYASLLHDTAKLRPDDIDLRVKVSATLLTLPAMAESLHVSDERRDTAWRREAAAEADALIAKAPSNARVYSLRGGICEAQGEPPLSCLRLYAKCLAIDPAYGRCKDSYAAAAEKYTSPRCTGAAIRSDLGLRLGTTTPRPGAKSETIDETMLYVDPVPSFTSRDIESIQARHVTTESATFDPDAGTFQPDPEREEAASLVTMRKERRAAFAAWLATAPERGGNLVVTRGAAPLFHAQLHRSAPITSAWTLTVKIDELCAKIERPILPADLPPAPPRH